MPHNEIPSAFLIRALARRDADHCDGCGHRMFVKGPTGLCPFCRAARPLGAAGPLAPALGEREAFAPRLGSPGRIPLGRRLRERVRRPRGSSAPGTRALLAPPPAGAPHPTAG